MAAASMMALVAKPVAGQRGRLSGSATFAPVDAAALGVTRPASMGLFVGEAQYVGAAGLGVGNGALRGFVGRSASDWSFGGGYARTLATGQLGSAIHTSIGGELVGGYRHYARSSAAANLTMPLGLTFGDPNRPFLRGPSFAIYIAPYAETGVTRAPSYALGAGAGTRFSLGNFALELMVRDVGPSRRWEKFGFPTLGLNYRLGPAI
jgi:hypothetical protein